MILTLEVMAPDPASLGASAAQAFGPDGGTIGRSRSCSWMLPDGRVSNKHAVISCADGVFYIEDTSTNGVYLNQSDIRLIQGRPEPLSHGDHITIGPYAIRVLLGEAPGRRAAHPAAASDPFGIPEMSPYGLADDFGAPLADRRPDNPLPAAAGDSQILDPLALLDDGRGGAAARRPPASPPVDPMQAHSPLADHYRPPSPRQPPAPPPVASPFIPEDYDPLNPDSGSFSSPSAQASSRAPAPADPARVPGALASRSAPPQPRPAARAPVNVTREDDPFHLDSGASGVHERTGALPRMPADVTPPPRPRLPRPPGSTGGTGTLLRPDAARSGPHRVSTANPLAEVLAGAGLPDAVVSEELGRDLGKILAVVVGGVMDVLRARQQIKDEFRMRVTQFQPADNNPLKFSANVEDALHNLLVKRNAAYLSPVEAFEDAFDDLRGHQLAMLAGMRVAFDALLRQFDAGRLQEQFDRQVKKGALVAVPAKLRYWDMYREHVATLLADADGTFRRLFAEEFARAYDDQLAALRAAKRDDSAGR